MRNLSIILLVLLTAYTLSWGEERSYTYGYSVNPQVNTFNFTNYSAITSAVNTGSNIGASSAMQAQNNLNAFRNSINQQAPPALIQPRPIFYVNPYTAAEQNTQNLNTYLDYSSRLKRAKDEALKYDYLKNNPSAASTLDLEEFKPVTSQTGLLVNPQAK